LPAIIAAQPHREGPGGWIRPHDDNRNGMLEASEIAAAIERTFSAIDIDKSGTLEEAELRALPQPRPGRPEDGPPRDGRRPDGSPEPGRNQIALLPPFLFADKVRNDGGVTRERFVTLVNEAIKALDQNGDGAISGREAEAAAPGKKDMKQGPPPNAQFLGAEMRFGDTPVKGRPFSAETLIEDTRVLFDGSKVKNTRSGAIYRDGAGRVRREQTLDTIAGTRVLAADDKPQKLVFITDFTAGNQIFLDQNSRVARRFRLDPKGERRPGDSGPDEDAGTVVGTKSIDGVTCELRRSEHEIPVGRIGNSTALKVVSERCYSTELQVVIMSSHRDPVAGLHEFTLRNIKRVEPAAELFAIPASYRIEN
jgi:hypothetical protein